MSTAVLSGCSLGKRVMLNARSTAGAQRLNFEAARAVYPGVLVADDGLRRRRRGLYRHALELAHRGAHRKDLDQAGSEFDDVGLDAYNFLGAQCGRLAVEP